MVTNFCSSSTAEKQSWSRNVDISLQLWPLWPNVSVTTSLGHFLSGNSCRSRKIKGIPAITFWPKISAPFCRDFQIHILIILATGIMWIVSLKGNWGGLPCCEWLCSLNFMGICIVMEFKSPLSLLSALVCSLLVFSSCILMNWEMRGKSCPEKAQWLDFTPMWH